MEEQRSVAQELLAVMGARPQSDDFGLDELLHALAYDKHSATSIAGSLGAARENARRARETVSSGLWESLNTTYYGLNQHRKDVVGTYRFCNWVLERTAMVSGLADTTVSHDESWLFLVLGRSLERADMTARMLSTRDVLSAGMSWVNMPAAPAPTSRSCGPAVPPSATSTRPSSCCWTGSSRVPSSTPCATPTSAWPNSTPRPSASASSTTPDGSWARPGLSWSSTAPTT